MSLMDNDDYGFGDNFLKLLAFVAVFFMITVFIVVIMNGTESNDPEPTPSITMGYTVGHG